MSRRPGGRGSLPLQEFEERYSRQVLLAEMGDEGQLGLRKSSILVVGCGALGCHLADALVRAGVGRVAIVDRDLPELNNLQRQTLFDEDDVRDGLPKAEAAVRKLRKINSSVEIEGYVEDLTFRNVEGLIVGRSLVLDGTDNFETRYLINDACSKHGIPWIYGGVIGTSGMTMTVVPGRGPCLRCLLPASPPPGSLPTCESQGVLGTAPAVIASIQATEAIKLLTGAEPSTELLSVDLWTQSFRRIKVAVADDCPVCQRGSFDFLEGRETSWTTTLCGRNSIQITPPGYTALALERLSESLASSGKVSFNGYLIKFLVKGYEMILFPDGRAIVKGTTEESEARSLYAKYLGT
jgi:adenylyltransferase/sulfurtransferase